MKKTILFLASFLLIGAISAQRNCATMENLERLKALDPTMESRMLEIEQQTQQAILLENTNRGMTAINNIPVVVHVVYNTSVQNITDAQIQSQITILNNDFRRLNADRVNTPSTFTTVAADAEITFCLATVSPTGAATTGIIRTSTSVTSFSDNDAVKYASLGGQDAWPANKYLNLWICNLGGGLLGYAQFPGGPLATDGVVVGYNYIGNTGTATAPFNKGRTTTHEVGHWLNLRHIWGDASCGNDLVTDTPVHAAENYSCPAHPKANGCGTSAEMFMNYMDYTDDACMNMFSLGQKSRMKALFAVGGAKESLLTSTGCGGTTSTTCAVPVSLNAASITTTGATLSWGAVSSASSYNVKYKKTALTTWTTTTSTSASKTISGLSASTTYEFQVQTVCSGGSSAFSASKTFATTSTTSTSSTITVGSGTAATATAPYGTYYMDEKVQFIITKAELTAAGYTSTNNILRSLAFNVYAASSQTMNGFSIKMRHTTAGSFSSSSYYSSTSMTTVYTANYIASTGWNTHTFTSPFTYNGTGNILVEICWNNSSYTTDSKVYYTTTSTNNALYSKADVASGGVCAYTTGTLSTSRPNMRFVFSGYSSVFSSKLIPEDDNLEPDQLVPSDFNLYPNPAADKINVEYTLINENNIVVISIYNIMGSLVGQYEQGSLGAGQHLFSLDFASDPNLSAMSDGIYLCTVNIEGVTQTKRFVVSKR